MFPTNNHRSLEPEPKVEIAPKVIYVKDNENLNVFYVYKSYGKLKTAISTFKAMRQICTAQQAPKHNRNYLIEIRTCCYY